MSELDRLVTDVIADPNADQPRESLADWYAAQPESDLAAQARAKFIRDQLKHFSISQGPPPYVGLSILSMACSTALIAYQQHWLTNFLPKVEEVKFHRGCVEYIRCTLSQFVHAAPLFALAPIRHLDLILRAADDIAMLDAPQLLSIQTLSITSAGLGERELRVLANLKHTQNICWLDLSSNLIDEPAVEQLVQSTSFPLLEYVELARNPCDPIEAFADEFGAVTDTWLPEQGEKLEKKYGRVRWFHREGEDITSWQADRFLLVHQSQTLMTANP